jgi:hypothetical protein
MMQLQELQAPDQAQWASSFEALATQARHKSKLFRISHTYVLRGRESQRARKDEKPLLSHGGHATPLHILLAWIKMISMPPQLQKDLPLLTLLGLQLYRQLLAQ